MAYDAVLEAREIASGKMKTFREAIKQRGDDPMPERFMMAQDNDSHWYVIPIAKQQEWFEWCEIGSDDERAWTPPDFAKATGGSYSLVTFTNPEISE